MTQKYSEIYQKSIKNREDFWKEISNDIFWYKKPSKILNSDNPPFYKWFEDGVTNTCYNALDLHIDEGRGDKLAIICHEIAVISERRINQILDPQWSNLSAFLTNKEGLESGLMIIQYVAAAIISELHLLANPATTSNVPVSMGKEDHVSMGATGTYRSLKSSKYLSQVLANELICATEALERLNESPGLGVKKIKDWVRTKVDKLDCDKTLTKECEELSTSIINGEMSEIFG